MDRQLKQFLDWAHRKLRHLGPEKCREVMAEVESYFRAAQQKQNISYGQLISSLGDRVQFLNGFLLKLGECPLPPERRLLRTVMAIFAALFVTGGLGVLALYHYIDQQFDFDLADGKLKLFGQIIDTDKMDLTYSTSNFAQKYVRKHSTIDSQTHFQIKLQHTRTTLSYHPEGQHFYTVECEIEHDRELSLSQEQDNLIIEVGGASNCDLTLPRASTSEANFDQGRVTIERPVSSFKIYGNDGHITWIKDVHSKFKIFYNVQNGATRGDFDDIFDQKASREAHIKLQNGSLSFERSQ